MSEEEKKVIEHNSFNTSSRTGEYEITFETNNKNNYLFMQELARLFIDRNYKPKEFERLKLNNEYLQKDCNTLKKQIEKQQKEIEELKKDNNHQWEERCRLTFELQETQHRLSKIELQLLEEE